MKMDIFTFIAKQYGKVIFIFGTDLKKIFFRKVENTGDLNVFFHT